MDDTSWTAGGGGHVHDRTHSETEDFTMPVTTIKRCQSDRDWWYTVEDCNIEVDEVPGSGLAIKSYDEWSLEGRTILSVGREDALLIRDAINQLYPPETQP
jgi:hypothetical protein